MILLLPQIQKLIITEAIIIDVILVSSQQKGSRDSYRKLH